MKDSIGISFFKFIDKLILLRIVVTPLHILNALLHRYLRFETFRARVEPRLISLKLRNSFIASQVHLEVQLLFVVVVDMVVHYSRSVARIFKVDDSGHIG